ncbi:sigma-70 family RNA polymerase sigma factor (plasmid) [Sphingomonas paeninsulae]|uniref:Sigma-70 family RNA polymerase sigma factor n=1 Tax=Sphingomonas paeninsulae TaxID=2319844 RepID=A0A494TDI9_SPHPE|nr:sigma-70 family RNA polymerase sigma factor [Sphingomonas paeninsulae]AYJ85342.1 sigma-70 family RNA polymerase sigma factor [Sphingomonas paeninsulae]
MRASEDQLRIWMIGGLDGDSAAYTALLDALVPMLRSFFGRRLRGAVDDVEDLVQDTMIAIHTRRASYDRDRLFTAWAYAIARYKMIDHFRRSRVTVPMEGLENILIAEGFENATSARVDVDRLLDDLPAKQAQVIRQTKIEGLSTAEAAERGAISESAVKVSVHRGLLTLAKRLKGDG